MGGATYRDAATGEPKRVEKLLTLGAYPDVSLQDARALRDEARKLLATGVDPAEHRKAVKATRADRAAHSFEAIAREWYAKHGAGWAASHGTRIMRRFEANVFPWIGDRPIADIQPTELLAVVRRIEERGALETAHRALAACGRVFRYAVQTGRAERDISRDLRGALPPVKGTHFAAVIEPKRIGELLRMLDAYSGSPVVQAALRLAPLVFVRPGELRQAEWSEIDFEKAQWVIPAARMKMREAHLVPLSAQAVAILRDLHRFTGAGRFVFPNGRGNDRAMSDNAVLAALRRLGIPKEEMTGHGFRAMARTILEEVLGFPVEHIEHQLAHAVKDALGRAYNRTTHLPARRKMMQAWADYLDRLRTGADVIAFPVAH